MIRSLSNFKNIFLTNWDFQYGSYYFFFFVEIYKFLRCQNASVINNKEEEENYNKKFLKY